MSQNAQLFKLSIECSLCLKALHRILMQESELSHDSSDFKLSQQAFIATFVKSVMLWVSIQTATETLRRTVEDQIKTDSFV